MNCPNCGSGFVTPITLSPIRRLQCVACNHIWIDEEYVNDTDPPATVKTGSVVLRGSREWLLDIMRTISVAVFESPRGRAEYDDIVIEVLEDKQG